MTIREKLKSILENPQTKQQMMPVNDWQNCGFEYEDETVYLYAYNENEDGELKTYCTEVCFVVKSRPQSISEYNWRNDEVRLSKGMETELGQMIYDFWESEMNEKQNRENDYLENSKGIQETKELLEHNHYKW